jgi:hypothetical protein
MDLRTRLRLSGKFVRGKLLTGELSGRYERSSWTDRGKSEPHPARLDELVKARSQVFLRRRYTRLL